MNSFNHIGVSLLVLAALVEFGLSEPTEAATPSPEACPSLVTLGSSVECNEMVSGDSCTQDCIAATHFSYLSGDLTRQCINGTWDGTPLACLATCPAPSGLNEMLDGAKFYSHYSGLGPIEPFTPNGLDTSVTLVWAVPKWVDEELTKLAINEQFLYTFDNQMYWQKDTVLDPCYDFYFISASWSDLKPNLERTLDGVDVVFGGITTAEFGRNVEIGDTGIFVAQTQESLARFQFRFQNYVEVATCESCIGLDVYILPEGVLLRSSVPNTGIGVTVDFDEIPYVEMVLVVVMLIDKPYALAPWIGYSTSNNDRAIIYSMEEIDSVLLEQKDCDAGSPRCQQLFAARIWAIEPSCNLNGVYDLAFDIVCMPNDPDCTPPKAKGDEFTHYMCNQTASGPPEHTIPEVDAHYTVDFYWTPTETVPQIGEVVRVQASNDVNHKVPIVRTEAGQTKLRIWTSNNISETCLTADLALGVQYRITISVTEFFERSVWVNDLIYPPCTLTMDPVQVKPNIEIYIGGHIGTIPAIGTVCNLRYFRGENLIPSEIGPDVSVSYTMNDDNTDWCPITLANIDVTASVSLFSDASYTTQSNQFVILGYVFARLRVQTVGMSEISGLSVVQATAEYSNAPDPIDLISANDVDWDGGNGCTSNPDPEFCDISFLISAGSFPISLLTATETIKLTFTIQVLYIHSTKKKMKLMQITNSDTVDERVVTYFTPIVPEELVEEEISDVKDDVTSSVVKNGVIGLFALLCVACVVLNK